MYEKTSSNNKKSCFFVFSPYLFIAFIVFVSICPLPGLWCLCGRNLHIIVLPPKKKKKNAIFFLFFFPRTFLCLTFFQNVCSQICFWFRFFYFSITIAGCLFFFFFFFLFPITIKSSSLTAQPTHFLSLVGTPDSTTVEQWENPDLNSWALIFPALLSSGPENKKKTPTLIQSPDTVISPSL